MKEEKKMNEDDIKIKNDDLIIKEENKNEN